MKEQISRLQVAYILYEQVIGLGILSISFMISHFVIRDAWMVGLTFIPGAVLVAIVIAWFMRTFPGQNLMEGLETAFGKWLGKGAGAWVLLWMYILACNELRTTTQFVSTTLYPNTPLYVLNVLFIITVGYAVYKGLETIGRMAEIIVPFGFIITLILFLLAWREADFSQFKPVLADGLKPVLSGTVYPWSQAMKFLITLFFVQSLPKGAPIRRVLIVAGVAIGLTGMFTEITITSILGLTRENTRYPALEVVRTVHVGIFLERLDTLYVISLIVTDFLNFAGIAYATSVGMKHLFNLSSYKPLAWSGGMAVWAGSIFLFRDEQMLTDFNLHVLPSYSYFSALFIPLLAILVQLVRNRRSAACKANNMAPPA